MVRNSIVKMRGEMYTKGAKANKKRDDFLWQEAKNMKLTCVTGQY